MYTILWLFITVQIIMGATDTLVHHELTEKLAWRPQQTHELLLHAIRNIFYAIIFFGLATVQPSGVWAYAIITALCLELLLTLRDFAEEDLTRKLPMSERLLHTVLTANYGVVLALLIPVIWVWGKSPTGLTPVWYGYWSLLLIFAAISVFIFGLRDFHAMARLRKLYTRPIEQLIGKTDSPKTILITGGTGFIGRRLIPALQHAGHKIIVLTRNSRAADLPAPISYIEDLTQIRNSETINVIINFAGEALSNGLWTANKKQKIVESRIGLTQKLNALIDRLTIKPELLLNGSAIGVYGVNPTAEMTETTPIMVDGTFSQELCLDWEAEALKAEKQGLRVVLFRIGMVLDRDGAALRQLLIPTELGGGATFGKGDQYMSWISRDDIVGMVGHIIQTPTINGPVNGVSPTPITNKVFTKAVANALYRPTLVQIPKFVMRALGGLGREILLADQRVLPQTALDTGYSFKDPHIQAAMLQQLRAQRKAKRDITLPNAVLKEV